MMAWLLPSIIATAAGTALLAFVYCYLYFLDRKKYLAIWALSWFVYFARFTFMIGMLYTGNSRILLIGNQLACLVSGIILLWGTYQFIEKRFPKAWTYCSGVGAVWIVMSISFQFDFLIMAIPTFTFLAIVYIWTGLVFLKSDVCQGSEKRITGFAFILWGLHKGNYPFLRPVLWFAPWGYLLAAMLEFVVAMGMLLVYFRKTRDDLKEGRYFLQKAQEIGKIGTWEMDVRKNELFWTEENYRIFGVPSGKRLTYETFLDRVHPDDRDYVEKAWKNAFNSKFYDIVHRLLVDGQVKWVREKASLEFNENGECVRGVGVTQDITEQKMIENRIRSMAERLDLATRAAGLGVWDWDLGTGRLSWDERMYALYGLKKNATSNAYESWLKGLHPEDRPAIEALLRQAKRGEKEYDTEFRVVRPDGTVKFIKALGSVLRDSEGRPIRMTGISYDITELKEMESRLQESQKMESIGNLAGGIAHDFNNILFPIVGMAELLLEDLPPNSEEYENAREILKAGMRGSDLVQQILAFSRRADHKMIPLRIQPILKDVLKLGRFTIPANIDIQDNIQRECGLIIGDAAQIHQVVMNLVTNAYHAVENMGGTISIRLRQRVLSIEDLSGTSLNPGPHAVLTVSDTGCGIDPENINKIFDPYFTTKEQGKGTGLGLAVAYGIVKGHGGEIRVSSEKGTGATFEIYLPLMKESTTDESVQRPETQPKGHERILLVDDEEAAVQVEKLMLEKLGYRVTACNSSEEAFNLFKTDPDAFDLVITDMAMPKMTGDELARRLNAIKPDTPVILSTGYSERISDQKANFEGIRAILSKPVLKSAMAGTVREVLDGKAGVFKM